MGLSHSDGVSQWSNLKVDARLVLLHDLATKAFQAVMNRMAEAGLSPELLTPEQSVAAQLKVIENLSGDKNGAFLSYNGDVIPY